MDDNTTSAKAGSKWLKRILLLFMLLFIVAGGIAFGAYQIIKGPTLALKKKSVITIPAQQSIEALALQLQQLNIIESPWQFEFVAKLMRFSPKAGKYEVKPSIKSHYNLIAKLRGSQLAVKIKLNNLRKIEQVAGYVSQQIQADSSAIMDLLLDESFLQENGFNTFNTMAIFIPNTYEMYWNEDAKGFVKRMLSEHKRFWNKERKQKADSLKLSPNEVYTLASIVECESQYKPERQRIAGVYLNRLTTKGWLLEADPTVIFAVGDFSIKRVLNVHLEYDSPYNTYRNAGLPPGPIYMASINAIDAVLNAESHDYMFFCAHPYEPGQPNTHAFAKSFRAHQNNARRYWKWLRSQR